MLDVVVWLSAGCEGSILCRLTSRIMAMIGYARIGANAPAYPCRSNRMTLPLISAKSKSPARLTLVLVYVHRPMLGRRSRLADPLGRARQIGPFLIRPELLITRQTSDRRSPELRQPSRVGTCIRRNGNGKSVYLHVEWRQLVVHRPQPTKLSTVTLSPVPIAVDTERKIVPAETDSTSSTG